MTELHHPTRRDIYHLATQLQQQATGQTDNHIPNKYLIKAEQQLTPAIILAISHELRYHSILRTAGDIFYEDYYYDLRNPQLSNKNQYNPPYPPLTRGRLENNNTYTIKTPNSPSKQFDLNNTTELNSLIQHLGGHIMHTDGQQIIAYLGEDRHLYLHQPDKTICQFAGRIMFHDNLKIIFITEIPERYDGGKVIPPPNYTIQGLNTPITPPKK